MRKPRILPSILLPFFFHNVPVSPLFVPLPAFPRSSCIAPAKDDAASTAPQEPSSAFSFMGGGTPSPGPGDEQAAPVSAFNFMAGGSAVEEDSAPAEEAEPAEANGFPFISPAPETSGGFSFIADPAPEEAPPLPLAPAVSASSSPPTPPKPVPKLSPEESLLASIVPGAPSNKMMPLAAPSLASPTGDGNGVRKKKRSVRVGYARSGDEAAAAAATGSAPLTADPAASAAISDIMPEPEVPTPSGAPSTADMTSSSEGASSVSSSSASEDAQQIQAMLAAAGVSDRYSDLQAFGIASASDLASLQDQDLASNFGLSPSQVEAFRRAIAAGSSVEPVVPSTPLASVESTPVVQAEASAGTLGPVEESAAVEAGVTATVPEIESVEDAQPTAATGASADLHTGATSAAKPELEPAAAVVTSEQAPGTNSAEPLPPPPAAAAAAVATAPPLMPPMYSANPSSGTEAEPSDAAAAAAIAVVENSPPPLRPGAEFEMQAQALVAAFAKEASCEEACLASAHRATLEGEAACTRWEAALLVAERDARAVEARQARLAEAEDYDGAEALSGQVGSLAADAEV